MKLIHAMVAPHRVPQVIHALRHLPHFPGYTLLNGVGESRGQGLGGTHVPSEADIDARRCQVLLIACPDDEAEQIADIIRQEAHTGLTGDGLVLIGDLLDARRIRTDERGDAAL